jgi:hypothetical protein
LGMLGYVRLASASAVPPSESGKKEREKHTHTHTRAWGIIHQPISPSPSQDKSLMGSWLDMDE